MTIIRRAPSGDSAELTHAVDFVGRDLGPLLQRLDTQQEKELWTVLHA
jgi:hypothetical protein